MGKQHIGSSIDDFLKAEGTYEEAMASLHTGWAMAEKVGILSDEEIEQEIDEVRTARQKRNSDASRSD